jgi:hypothetical protein
VAKAPRVSRAGRFVISARPDWRLALRTVQWRLWWQWGRGCGRRGGYRGSTVPTGSPVCNVGAAGSSGAGGMRSAGGDDMQGNPGARGADGQDGHRGVRRGSARRERALHVAQRGTRSWSPSAVHATLGRGRYRGTLTWGKLAKGYKRGTKVRTVPSGARMAPGGGASPRAADPARP